MELNSVNFKTKKTPCIIMWFTSWCSHCQNAKPHYEKLYQFSKNNPGINVYKVDCEKNSELAKNEGVQGYPTIVFINTKGKEQYNNSRDTESFISFYKEKLKEQNGGSRNNCGKKTKKGTKCKNSKNCKIHSKKIKEKKRFE